MSVGAKRCCNTSFSLYVLRKARKRKLWRCKKNVINDERIRSIKMVEYVCNLFFKVVNIYSMSKYYVRSYFDSKRKIEFKYVISINEQSAKFQNAPVS